MSLASDTLQPSVVALLFTLSGRTAHCNLPDIIAPTNKAGFDLNFDDANKAIAIDFRETEHIGLAIAGDALRFASAAFVSAKAIEAAVEDRTSLPWALIRFYYSAFYAGHGIIRLLGQSCSYLDREHINILQKLASAQGLVPSFTLQKGLYHCAMNPGQTGLTLTLASGPFGGAHEIFWKVFDEFLSSASVASLKSALVPIDAQRVSSKFDAMRSLLQSSGSGASWLSAIRNDIQYRHGHGVWEPPSIKKKDRSQMARFAQQWMRDPMNVDIEFTSGTLNRFVVGCAFVLALCRSLLTRIAERNSADGPSFARVPLSII